MTNEIKGGDTLELSSDINVITAEINAYQRVAGEAIFEIGRRLHHVKYHPAEYGLPEGTDKQGNTIVARGAWGEWLAGVSMEGSKARKFIEIYERFRLSFTGEQLPNSYSILYELTSFTDEELEQTYELPSGESKKPTEMSRREIEELKKALKASEQAKEQAERQADIERKQRERLEEEVEHLSEREPEIRYETKTEYIEVGVEEPYNRMNDEPFSVERGNEFYSMMREIDELYKKYAHLKDSVEELRGIATYDDDMKLKYRKADEFWRMIGNIFRESNTNIIDVEII